MSDLRGWSEEGATAAESSLLAASRSERAPAHARARTLKALGIAAAVSTTAVTAATTASATTGGVSLLTKILGISILTGGLVAGGLVVRASRVAPPSPAPAGTPPSSASAATEPGPKEADPPPEPGPAAPPSASASLSPVHASAPSRPAHGASPDDRLSQEVVALERAHQALASRDPGAALRLLDRYRAQFPGGALASEATVLRAQALLAEGDLTGAQTLADAYSAAHPDSPYARRIEDLVRGAQKK
jgi:Tetratricopeptide repeat